MITSILYSSPSFEAVDYNERKVAKGDATLLSIENFGYLGDTQDFTADYLRQYLQEYSARNERIQKPQMHVAFSCKGQEMSHEELANYARQWLAEMGYANPKQPLLIYAHKDTDNNHIHIITSRVDPEGKKINHHHERVRSKAFVERTLGVDTKSELQDVLQNSLSYRFESLGQWQAIMESSGYHVAQEGEILKIERNGAYQHTLEQKEVVGHFSKEYAEKQRLRQLRAILLKYRDHACNKQELKELMKRKFGVDLVFFGEKDNPRGYFVVDHKEKAVYKGSSILKVGELLTFEDRDEKLKRIDAFIDERLSENPRLTSTELNRLLRKHYSASYRNGVLHQVNFSTRILPYMSAAIAYNDKVELLKSLHYATQEELEAACLHFKVKSEDVPFVYTPTDIQPLIQAAKESLQAGEQLRNRANYLRRLNLDLIYHKGKFFLLDKKTRSICCLDDKGIKLIPSNRQISQHNSKGQTKGAVRNPLNQGKGRAASRGSSTNREWEVGTRGDYDEIDNERKLKR